MPGIIHFDRFSRLGRAVSRRSLMIGTAGYAGAAVSGSLFATAQGTPTSDGSSGPGTRPAEDARQRLAALLGIVPENQLGGADLETLLCAWADVQMQLAALGNPDVLDDPALSQAAISPLFMIDPLITSAMQPEAKETFGFSSLEAHQTLVTGTPPNQVTFYAGGVPIDDLPSIWEAAGYAHKTGDHGDYWTVGEDGEMNLDSPIGQIGAGLLNNVAIVNDDVLVFAAK